MDGAKIQPMMQIRLSKIINAVATRFDRRKASSSPLICCTCVNVVTKAADSAPSANRSRSKLGIRNAVRKASYCRPAPKSAAKTWSRTKPSTRLAITARLMMPALRATLARACWVSCSAIGCER